MIQILPAPLPTLDEFLNLTALSVPIFKTKVMMIIIIVIMMMLSLISKGCCKDYVFVKYLVHTKNYRTCFLAAFIIAKKLKQAKCLSTEEWIHKMWYLHIIEYSVVKRDELLIRATAWMNLGNMLCERSQTEKATYCDSVYVKCELYRDRR